MRLASIKREAIQSKSVSVRVLEAQLKLVWAVNPFDESRKLKRVAVSILTAIARARDRVEAVYVASPGEVELAIALDVPAEKRFAGYPKSLVEKSLREMGIEQVSATVLTQHEVSLTSSVKTLAGYSVRGKADIILVASHARKGVSRLVLGSFAETLVHFSKTDLLVFNESTRALKRRPEVLLIAHDLSQAGDRGFEKALVYAKKWRCTLHVVHVPEPAYGLRFDDQDKRVEAYRGKVKAETQRVETTLKRARVAGSVVIDRKWAPISERILAQARRVGADVVLVVAKSGRLAGLMGGSVTRQIIRKSTAPVLVVKVT
jgi:nucleotide-binding universal stress UspA family protein